MIKQWNGAIWKVIMTKNFLRVERFAQSEKADFPYSIVEVDPCKIIAEPDYNPTEQIGNDTVHARAGAISLMVDNVVELWHLILDIIEEGKDV